MFCVRGFGGGVGVSLFFGGCSGLSVVFSRASGVSWFLACSAPDCWGGWRVVGGSGVRGLARLFPALLLVGGGFGGASARVRFLVVRFWLWSGSVGRGRGCACCPVPVVGVGLCPVSCSCSRCCCRVRGGFSGVVFSVRRFSCFFWFPVLVFVVLPGVGGLWGVSGWVRGFFLRLLLYWPGPVWVWVGFCLESLILAQDERWRRA